MALISYWIASLKKPKPIPQRRTSTFAAKKICSQCREWKPNRAHHCSICGTCIAKMDHHCPWLGTCVGYHNFKPFFLFCFYQCLSGQVWNYILIQRLFYAPKDIERLGTVGSICYYVTNILDIPITFALIGLSGNILLQMYQNLTTLEQYERGVAHQQRYPLFGVP